MLRADGQWEELSDRERLVLLAMAFELPHVVGTNVQDYTILVNSGLKKSDFDETKRTLTEKDLVKDTDDGMELKGDALTIAFSVNARPLVRYVHPLRSHGNI